MTAADIEIHQRSCRVNFFRANRNENKVSGNIPSQTNHSTKQQPFGEKPSAQRKSPKPSANEPDSACSTKDLYPKNLLKNWNGQSLAPELYEIARKTASEQEGVLPISAVATTSSKPKCTAFGIGCASLQGRRSKNDDYVQIDARTQAIAIADGIGGAPDGNIASRVACNVALEAYAQTHDLISAFRAANSATLQTMHYLGSDGEGAGTTLLLATYNELFVDIAFAGDTYAYALKGGQLTRITDNGRIGNTNALTNCIGYQPDCHPTFTRIYCSDFDKLLLCTDGVWSAMTPETLANLLNQSLNPRDLATKVARQGANKGSDNATVAILLNDPHASSTCEPENNYI